MTPALGAFGVMATTGWQAAGIRLVTHSPVNHAILFVGRQTFTYKGHLYVREPAVVEAQPGGAQLAPLFVYAASTTWSAAPPAGNVDAIVAQALGLLGTPYSFVDDACIGLADVFGWHVPKPIRKRLDARGHLMCSQLVDLAYRRAGVNLFADGRIPGDVSPGDLYDLIKAAELAPTAP